MSAKYKFSIPPFGQVEEVTTLEWYDGPLAAILKNETDHFIIYWADQTEKSHIWMVIRISEATVNEIVEGKISYRDALTVRNLDSFVTLYRLPDAASIQVTPEEIEQKDYLPAPRAGYGID